MAGLVLLALLACRNATPTETMQRTSIVLAFDLAAESSVEVASWSAGEERTLLGSMIVERAGAGQVRLNVPGWLAQHADKSRFRRPRRARRAPARESVAPAPPSPYLPFRLAVRTARPGYNKDGPWSPWVFAPATFTWRPDRGVYEVVVEGGEKKGVGVE